MKQMYFSILWPPAKINTLMFLSRACGDILKPQLLRMLYILAIRFLDYCTLYIQVLIIMTSLLMCCRKQDESFFQLSSFVAMLKKRVKIKIFYCCQHVNGSCINADLSMLPCCMHSNTLHRLMRFCSPLIWSLFLKSRWFIYICQTVFTIMKPLRLYSKVLFGDMH